MRGVWNKVTIIFWKDAVNELRTKEIIASVIVFALLVLVIFSFAIDPASGTTELVAPGILWVCFTFAGVLGLNRVFSVERDNSRMEGLKLCPVEGSIIYWGNYPITFKL